MEKQNIDLACLLAVGSKDLINPNAKDISGIKGEDKGTYFEYNFKTGEDLLSAIDIQSELYSSRYNNVK